MCMVRHPRSSPPPQALIPPAGVPAGVITLRPRGWRPEAGPRVVPPFAPKVVAPFAPRGALMPRPPSTPPPQELLQPTPPWRKAQALASEQPSRREVGAAVAASLRKDRPQRRGSSSSAGAAAEPAPKRSRAQPVREDPYGGVMDDPYGDVKAEPVKAESESSPEYLGVKREHD